MLMAIQGYDEMLFSLLRTVISIYSPLVMLHLCLNFRALMLTHGYLYVANIHIDLTQCGAA